MLRLIVIWLLFSFCAAAVQINTVTYSDNNCTAVTTHLTTPSGQCLEVDYLQFIINTFQPNTSLIQQCLYKQAGCGGNPFYCNQYPTSSCVNFPYPGTGNKTMAFYVAGGTTTSSAPLSHSFSLVGLALGYAVSLFVF